MATSQSEILSALTNALSSSGLASGGSGTFYKGQDSSLLPSQIDDACFYKGVNVTTKHGHLSPRGGYIQTNFELLNDKTISDDRGTNLKVSKVLASGKFQGAVHYYTEMGERIVAVYSGLIFMFNPKNKTVQYVEIDSENSSFKIYEERFEPFTQRLNQYTRRLNFSQAGAYLVIFDYPDRPVILDGYRAFRSPTNETDTLGNHRYYVPATVMGCYNTNRLFVCSASNTFTAGDPVGSLVAPYAPITFDEVYQEAGEFNGQTFSLGSTNKNNPITAMGFMQITDASTGIGNLYVATKDSLYTYNTGQGRALWSSAQSQTAFGMMSLYNAGIVGPKAVDNLNADLIFMDKYGHIRNYNSTHQYEASSWEHTPIDIEVWDWINTPLKEYLDMTVVKCFSNKVLVTVQPYRTKATDLYGRRTADYAFKGLVVLELDSMSGLNKQTTPAWAGVWTGLNYQDLITCNDELYIFSKDPAYINQVYKLDLESSQDFYNGEHKNIKCRIYTKQYTMDNAFKDKKERSVIVGLQGLSGNVKFDIARSNDFGKYTLWKHWEYEAPTCFMDTPITARPHYFRELNFGTPDITECNVVTGEYGELFRGIQFRLDIEAANWRLDYILALGDEQSSDYTENLCDIPTDVVDPENCEVTDFNLYHTAYYVED